MLLPVTNSVNLNPKAQEESQGSEGGVVKGSKSANSQVEFLNILQGL